MKNIFRNFVVAFSMYSKIPMPNVKWDEDSMKYPICFFPLVGLVIGLLLCGWRIAQPYLCNYSFLPAVIYVVVPVIVSGGIHVDGYIDTVDAICSRKPMEKKLEILKDTHTGAFAIIMTLSYFLIALGVWSEMPIDAVPLLAGGFVLSRALSGLALVTFPIAKTSKLLSVFADGAKKAVVRVVMALYIIACVAWMLWKSPIYGGACLLGAVLAFLYYFITMKRHFGGTTGDVAGYFVQVCELSMACFVLVAWKFI